MSNGADAPLGPGWWRASDGRYYPPELAPGASSQPGASGAPGPPIAASGSAPTAAPDGPHAKPAAPPKKKVVKKVAAKRAEGSATAPRKRVVKKVARPSPSKASPPADPPADEGADREPETTPLDTEDDETPRRPGQMKYTARAPASDQIAARRIQAKEQLVLLSDARQGAALRALASLGISQPELVGVGARSLDARGAPATGHPVPVPVPVEPVAKTTPTAVPSQAPAPAEEATGPQSAEARAQPTTGPAGPPPAAPSPTPQTTPALPEPASSTPPPVAPPPVTPPTISTGPPLARPSSVEATPPTGIPGDEAASDAAPDHGAEESTASGVTADPTLEVGDSTGSVTISPHQPLRGPAPTAAPMGTDVPFMEVKGSALGADLDRIGERILIFANRVELRDRSNTVRQTIRYDQLRSVEVHKKLMGPTLTVTSTLGATISVKALRSPELASGAKAMIDKHAARFREGGDRVTPEADLPTVGTIPGASSSAPSAAAPVPSPPAPAPHPTGTATPPTVPSTVREGGSGEGTHRTVLIAMLEELHDSGILSDEELEAKRSLIEGGPTI